MDFFEQQDVARRRTGRLIVYFLLAVIGIVVAIYCVVWFALTLAGGHAARAGAPNPYSDSLWHPELFALVAAATIGVILLASLIKTAQLASGGETVALMMGGRLVDSQTRNLAERRLRDVVEEIAIASGVPVPPVYVLDNESSINAFAAGHQPGDAVVAVSQGCLQFLNRDELQGVVAHEFSHILNGDMRLNLRLVGILYGILVIAVVGWYVLRSLRFSGRSSRGKGGGAVAMILLIALGLIVIGSVGWFFARLIQSAVSRQREYLADASAVQFTRLPDGIAGALKKIGGRPETSQIKDAHAEEISHMFFGSAFGSLRGQLFATHPPLIDRIQHIDPSFDGTFPKHVKPVTIEPASIKPQAGKRSPGEPFATMGAGRNMPLDPTGALRQIGLPGMTQLLYAAAIREDLPEPVRDAAHEPYGARAVVYAILLDRNSEIRQRQLDTLGQHAEADSNRETERLLPVVDRLPEEARLPLVQTAFPALKKLSPDQYTHFRENVKALIKADDKVDLLEYAIRMMLVRHLDVHFGRAVPIVGSRRRWELLLPSLMSVLSTMAHVGQKDPVAARHAFDRGMAEVRHAGKMLGRSDCSLKRLDAALQRLAEAAPNLKRQIICACTACAAADGKVTPREGQLLQAIAAMLDVPLAPIGATAKDGPSK